VSIRPAYTPPYAAPTAKPPSPEQELQEAIRKLQQAVKKFQEDVEKAKMQLEEEWKKWGQATAPSTTAK